MIVVAIVVLVVGFGALVYGADRLVDGASSLAARMRVSNILIGLTVVAFGTSCPELVVNVVSAIRGNTDIALGNVLGSNIFNILIILVLSACVRSLYVQYSTRQSEIPLALISAMALLVLGNDVLLNSDATNLLNRTDGIILLLFFAIFMGYIIQTARKEKGEHEDAVAKYGSGKSIILVLLGLVLLIIGAEAIVKASTYIAERLGMSELIIGLTIVALGTYLPELATSIVAARRNNMDIAIANIVGSNIFNAFFILGITAVIRPIPLQSGSTVDLWVNVGVSLLLLIFVYIGKEKAISRTKGIIFILCYLLYILWLFFFQR